MPDPFVFAIGLTGVAAALARLWTGRTWGAIVADWQSGFWSLLGFGMQMCWILVTGHAIATSRPVQRLLVRLSALPRSPSAAVATVAAIATLGGWFHWGLGLVGGAIAAREVGRSARARGMAVSYPLLGAAGYSGLAVWHGGLSGSAPLLVATQDHFLAGRIGAVPLRETILSGFNLGLSAALFVLVPLVFVGLARGASAREDAAVPPQVPAPPASEIATATTPAERINASAIPPLGVAAVVLSYTIHGLMVGTLSLDLNILNLIFLGLGLVLHRSTASYIDAVTDGARGAAGIILQFPFYAGILGIMRHSGLVDRLADAAVAASTARTFPLFTFLAAGAVNLFVPSGGGQWAVQGPIVAEAAERLGVPIGRAILAFAYGDQWTNLAQPFWALPLLGLTGLRARDIMGYTITVMLILGAVFGVALLLPI